MVAFTMFKNLKLNIYFYKTITWQPILGGCNVNFRAITKLIVKYLFVLVD